MTKERYREIRGKNNFLQVYFEEEGGAKLDSPTFSNLLAMWLMTVCQAHPQTGIANIANFLDKKFA